MTTYSVIIVTRALEKYGYLVNAENAETAKKKALDRLYNHIGMMIPCKKVTVHKTENLRRRWVKSPGRRAHGRCAAKFSLYHTVAHFVKWHFAQIF